MEPSLLVPKQWENKIIFTAGNQMVITVCLHINSCILFRYKSFKCPSGTNKFLIFVIILSNGSAFDHYKT